MATTPNYGWVMPDPTDLVTNLPADFETFGDAVDVDLAGLLGGTTGQVLTKDSATDLDFSWATVGGASADYTLLNIGGTALTGASTITVSGISNQDKLFIFIADARAGQFTNMTLRINSDTGSNYAQANNSISPNTTLNEFSFGASSSNFSRTSFLLGQTSINTSSTRLWAGMHIFGAKGTTGVKPIAFNAGIAPGTPTTNLQSTILWGNGAWKNSASITSISIISSVGNFDNGTIYVYGSSN